MAAPGGEAAGGFAAWLAARLEALGLDRAVYGAYIQGLLREEESDEERLEALRGVLAACLVRARPGWAGEFLSPVAGPGGTEPPGAGGGFRRASPPFPRP